MTLCSDRLHEIEVAEPAAEAERYSARDFACAEKLLQALRYDPARHGENESKRYRLFDRLSKIALASGLAAEESVGILAKSHLEYATVAQCAMEMLAAGKPFSRDVIAEAQAGTAKE
jgi:hypothetical protein